MKAKPDLTIDEHPVNGIKAYAASNNTSGYPGIATEESERSLKLL